MSGQTARLIFVSDLVGNPEDRFCRNAAQFLPKIACCVCSANGGTVGFPFEPRCEKTGLRGFRPGPTQTGLRSHLRWLEA